MDWTSALDRLALSGDKALAEDLNINWNSKFDNCLVVQFFKILGFDHTRLLI